LFEIAAQQLRNEPDERPKGFDIRAHELILPPYACEFRHGINSASALFEG